MRAPWTLLPSSQVALERSPRQVLLSGFWFPSLSKEQLLDKLELFFSKRQHQGGEVEATQWLSGSGHVALTLVDGKGMGGRGFTGAGRAQLREPTRGPRRVLTAALLQSNGWGDRFGLGLQQGEAIVLSFSPSLVSPPPPLVAIGKDRDS